MVPLWRHWNGAVSGMESLQSQLNEMTMLINDIVHSESVILIILIVITLTFL